MSPQICLIPLPCDTNAGTRPKESTDKFGPIRPLESHTNWANCLGSYWLLKGIDMKYLLHLGVIGFAFSTLSGCGESAEAKSARLQKEALESLQKLTESAAKLNNSMKK